MFYIWMMIAIIFMMLETLQSNCNYLCFSLGALIAIIINYFVGNYLIELMVFFFSGTGFILWLKPKLLLYRKK